MSFAHTLEVAGVIVRITCKCDLRFPSIQDFDNLPVRYIAHLVVLFYYVSILVANSTFAFGHQLVASLVGCTDIAVDTAPTFRTIAGIGGSHRSVISICQRAADYGELAGCVICIFLGSSTRREAIVASKAWRTRAFAIELVALGVLAAGKCWELAVETIENQYRVYCIENSSYHTMEDNRRMCRSSVRDGPVAYHC
jgi:hypothetical protein